MKKSSLLLSLMLCLGLFGVNTVSAQKQNAIKIIPLALAMSNVSISYERFFTEKASFQIQGGYWLGGTIGSAKFNGFSATPEVRFYVSDSESPKGFYLAPFARYEAWNGYDKEATSEKVTVSRIGGGAVAGYQFLMGKTVTMDIFTGPRYYSTSFKYEGATAEDIDLTRLGGGFGLRFGATLGVAF